MVGRCKGRPTEGTPLGLSLELRSFGDKAFINRAARFSFSFSSLIRGVEESEDFADIRPRHVSWAINRTEEKTCESVAHRPVEARDHGDCCAVFRLMIQSVLRSM